MEKSDINLIAVLGLRKEAISFSMPVDEWRRILKFRAEAEKLRKTSFVRNGMGGSISIAFSDNGEIRSNVKPVDEDPTSNMFMKLRPFILNDEDTNFYQIRNILARYSKNGPLNEQLKSIKNRFELQQIQNIESFNDFGNHLRTFKSVMDWLNAFEYHRDQEKQKRVMTELGGFGDEQDGRQVVLFSVVEIIAAILMLSDVANGISEHSEI